MSRGLFFSIFLLFLNFESISQQIGNEWIDYNFDYYKLTLNQDGIYRVTYDDLINAGFPVSTVNPRRIKVFHRGIEQSVFINGENDSQLNPGDYIEFYGIRNNGELDSLLYEPYSALPHTYYNLYSDTSSYFLTWDKSNISNGKRMDFYQENNTGGLPEESYYLEELLELQTNQYSLGVITGDYISRSAFIEGEGWTGSRIQEGSMSDIIINGITNTFVSSAKPTLEIVLAGRNSLTHDLEIEVGENTTSLRTLTNIQFDGFINSYVSEEIEWTDISASGELAIRINVLSNGSPLSNVSVSAIKLVYPKTLDMESAVNSYFDLIPNGGGKSFVKIINTPTNPVFYDVTDRNNAIRIGFSGAANEIEAVIRNTGVSRKLFATAPIVLTPTIEQIDLKTFAPATIDYIIISHPKLMKSSGGFNDAVKEYATYRASVEGGGYDTLIMSIRDLYNQFSYGEVSPLAVRNFMRFMDLNANPSFLFIIGKGLDIGFNYYRNDPLSFSFGDLVPLGGQPGSDAIYTQNLNGATYEPGIATGRLTAFTPDDVINYLEKIKEKEAVPFDNFFQKRLLHLSGGKVTFELSLFESFVNGFEAIAVEEFYGGNAKTFSKNTASTVEFVDISQEINEGVNIVTFFGHSAPGIIDIDVGVPSNPIYGYDNKGKYPTFFVNGCRSGDFFGDYISWGADWVLTPDKGASSFIAHTYFGFSSTLRRFNENFYDVGFADSTFIKRTLGEIHKETGRRFLSENSDSDVNINQVQQMILIGDPATRLFGTNISDYAIENTSIFAIPAEGETQITSNSASFDLGIIVDNFGAAFNDSLEVTVKRISPGGVIQDLDTVNFAAPFFSDTLYYTIQNTGASVEGFNRFEITINPNQNLVELDYNNNFGIFSLNIPAGATTNVFPYEFAFLPNEQTTLSTQASDVLGNERTFQFQVDTTQSFNSSYLQEQVQPSNLLSLWTPTLIDNSTDTITYYWRTKFHDPLPGEIDEWNEQSFTLAPDAQPGWAQVRFEQFYKSQFVDVIYDSINGVFEFPETGTQVFIRTFGTDNPNVDNTDIEVNINGIIYMIEGRYCRDNSLSLIAFDKSNSLPYAGIFEDVNSPRTCGRQPQIINNFSTADITGANDYLSLYTSSVGEGDVVILFSIGTVDIDTWSNEVLNNLDQLGIDQTTFLSNINPGEPFIVVGRKGSIPGQEEYTLSDIDPKSEQEISLNKQVTGVLSSGTITSSIVGPSIDWNSLYSNVRFETGDEATLDVIGLNQGVESLLFSDVPIGSFDISTIDAATYRNIKLRLKLADEENLTAPQLDQWVVAYEAPGEGILLWSGNSRNNSLKNSLIEGESITTDFAFVNISDKALADSLKVQSSIFNYESREVTEELFNIGSPAPGDTTFFSSIAVTNNLIGGNDYTVTVNFDGSVPELRLTNNQIQFREYFTVKEDEINPVIDVVFDGERIFDGDVVSPTPIIAIEIQDENEFLLKEDTTGIDIFITYPEEQTERRISFSSNEITYTPATSSDPFSISYQPDFIDNGLYSLSIQATDASGNRAGTEPYQVNFEVINESTITHFYPYPNPFSSSTRFVFTLTGRSIPEEMKIQIMTISGKIVREITQDEIGPIRIGNNMTEYAWDGKDEYGDQLANGVYLYRVLSRINGENVDHRDSAGDKGFKQGFGKIYLLR